MINFEKYKDDILGLPEDAIPALKDGKIVDCNQLRCKDCDLDNSEVHCNYAFVRWLYEEAKSDTDNKSCDKELKSEKINNNSQSCEDCKYEDKHTNEEPCVSCSNHYILKFEPKYKPKLKPCPFCGGKAKKEEIGRSWGIECEDCQSSTRLCPTPEEAEEVWNRRV